MKNIYLKNITTNFSSNSDGVLLFSVFDKTIKEKKSILLEIDGETAMSSSFLNSSFGSFLDIYGLEKLKLHIKIKTSKNQFLRIKNYISKYEKVHLV